MATTGNWTDAAFAAFYASAGAAAPDVATATAATPATSTSSTSTISRGGSSGAGGPLVGVSRLSSSLAASALVFGGATAALIAFTIEGSGLPRGAGGAWARATFTSATEPGAADDTTMTVVLTVRGEVVVQGGADEDLLDQAEMEALAEAMPGSITTLGVGLAVGLMLASAAVAVFQDQMRALWSMIGAGALALLIVAVLLRHMAVSELGSWTHLTNLSQVETEATSLSIRPVVGAAIALAAALLGTVVTGKAPMHSAATSGSPSST